MKKFLVLFFTALTIAGCNSVYEYVFLPPPRVEYTLVPDESIMASLNDSSYYISKDGTTVGYDAKNWKIEIKYMSDYQLNNFEFPEESDDKELSGNPYTYGNWIDPELGYTPRKFTVFKVTVYNYTGSKLNYDPELTVLETDRGDYFHAYAREQKNSKYYSIEEYYKKRKGSSGVDEEIFETRMGIARRTMLYYGKPIYKGDSRDGLIVFDPIVDNVEKLKISVNDFIIGYDENNDPSDFIDLTFYFKQVPFQPDKPDTTTIATASADTSGRIKGDFTLAQIKYAIEATNQRGQGEFWNPVPTSLSSLLAYAEQNTELNTKLVQGTFDEDQVMKAQLAVILGGMAKPDLSESVASSCAEYIEEGGVVYMDNSYQNRDYAYNKVADDFMQKVKNRLSGKTEIKNISLEHPIFNIWQKLNRLPRGYDEHVLSSGTIDSIKGLFLNEKLVMIISAKGYPVMWSEDSGANYDTKEPRIFGLNLIVYSYKN